MIFMIKCCRTTYCIEPHDTLKIIHLEQFDKFFDYMNVSNFDAGKRQRKLFKQPYRSAQDFRLKVKSIILDFNPWLSYHCLQWLLEEFLPYLDSWETSVMERPGFTDVEKKKMLLSQPTLDGLRMTGMYVYNYDHNDLPSSVV